MAQTGSASIDRSTPVIACESVVARWSKSYFLSAGLSLLWVHRSSFSLAPRRIMHGSSSSPSSSHRSIDRRRLLHHSGPPCPPCQSNPPAPTPIEFDRRSSFVPIHLAARFDRSAGMEEGESVDRSPSSSVSKRKMLQAAHIHLPPHAMPSTFLTPPTHSLTRPRIAHRITPTNQQKTGGNGGPPPSHA